MIIKNFINYLIVNNKNKGKYLIVFTPIIFNEKYTNFRDEVLVNIKFIKIF